MAEMRQLMEWDALFVSSGGAARARIRAGSADVASGEGAEAGVRDVAQSSARMARTGAEKKASRRLTDSETEADEMFHNAGEKGTPQRDAEAPPRRRAHKRRGLGTMPTERPPI
jgi:hypothetical protein